jgi:hypothetical protein
MNRGSYCWRAQQCYCLGFTLHVEQLIRTVSTAPKGLPPSGKKQSQSWLFYEPNVEPSRLTLRSSFLIVP